MNSGGSRLSFATESIVAGKYRIDRTLAEGGMGVVVAATHLHLERPVALKFLRGDLGSELDAVARFTREAKAAAQLRSEYVAHVLDAGVTEDGTPYMAMEYLEGQSLAAVLRQRGSLDVPTAVEYIIQACEGLAEAHARGIVHRDIKPDNLFVVERAAGWSAIKILDFGISKFAFADTGNVATGVILGSPCYMSPEQLRSTANVDHRTDLWSLGATLYELLVGRAAFDPAQSLPELVTSILDVPSPRVRDERPDVPVELEMVVDRCLAKEREERFNSAGDLAAALLPFAAPRSRVPAEHAASMPPVFRVEPSPIAGDRPPSVTPRPPWPSDAPSFGDVTQANGSQRSTPLALAVRADDDGGDVKLDPAPSPSSNRRRATAAGGVAALTLALAFIVGLTLTDRERTPGVIAKPTAPVPSAPSQAPPPLAGAVARTERADPERPERADVPAERVEVIVRATPPSARVTIDDRPVENPFMASFPKDGATHRVAARAWGYEPKSTTVVTSADVIVDLGLDRRTVTASPLPASPPVAPAHTVAIAAAPMASVKDVKRRPAEPAVGETAPRPIAGPVGELDSAGGRAPLHPIDMKDPYGGP